MRDVVLEFCDDNTEIILQGGEIGRLAPGIRTLLVSVIHLKTNEDANNDDNEIQCDGGPFLIAEMVDDAAKDHCSVPPGESRIIAETRIDRKKGSTPANRFGVFHAPDSLLSG